jgi:hypothetical protein
VIPRLAEDHLPDGWHAQNMDMMGVVAPRDDYHAIRIHAQSVPPLVAWNLAAAHSDSRNRWHFRLGLTLRSSRLER